MRRPVAVSGLLGAVLRGSVIEQRLEEGRIWVVWEQAVGSRIASHAAPSAFRDGTLTLSVDSAPWMQQLNFLKRELVAKVNAELGQEMVTDIYLKAGRVSAPKPPDVPWEKPRRQLTAEELAWIAEQAESVADPGLRDVFERLIRKDRESR